MESKTLKVVMDEELAKLLEAIGLLNKVEAGEVLCEHCGAPVSLGDIAMIVPKSSNYAFVCGRPACIDLQLTLNAKANPDA